MSRIDSYITRPNGTLKKAHAEPINACGGLEAAAEMCRVSVRSLSNYCNPEQAKAHMPVEVVQALEWVSRKNPVSSYLAV